MKLGISTCTYTWNFGVKNYPAPQTPYTVEKLLEIAAGYNIEVVQILDNIVPIYNFPEKKLRALRDSAKEKGIQLEIGTRGITLPLLKQYLQIARLLGANLVRTILDGDHASPSLNQAIEWIQKILPDYKANGISLAIENHDLRHVAELRKLADTINDPNFGICIDCVNSLGIQECQQEVLDTLFPQTINFHYKDFIIQRTDYDMGFTVKGCIAGQGMTDMDYILRNRTHAKRDFNIILEQWMPWLGSIQKTAAVERDRAKMSILYLKSKLENNSKDDP